MPYEFDQAAVAYSEARSQCQVATDDALDTAQDLEAVAVEGLINTPSECLGDIDVKLAALDDLMEMSRWSDGRDVRLLASIRRDLKRAMRQDEALRARLQEACGLEKGPSGALG
jgi:hypothetical protein